MGFGTRCAFWFDVFFLFCFFLAGFILSVWIIARRAKVWEMFFLFWQSLSAVVFFHGIMVSREGAFRWVFGKRGAVSERASERGSYLPWAELIVDVPVCVPGI